MGESRVLIVNYPERDFRELQLIGGVRLCLELRHVCHGTRGPIPLCRLMASITRRLEAIVLQVERI